MNIEVEYLLPASIIYDPPTKVFIDWSLSFVADGDGEEANPIVCGVADAIRVEIGGEPFPEIRPASLCSKVMRAWVDTKAKELNPDVIGMTREECLRECPDARIIGGEYDA